MSLRRLFHVITGRSDPTALWPVVPAETPWIDLEHGMIGPLRFGDPIESSASLGKPSRFKDAGDWCTLTYAGAGFQLEFKRGRLRYVAFFVGDDRHGPSALDLKFATPRIASAAAFTCSTAPNDVIAILGEPNTSDLDDEELVQTYRLPLWTIECEFNSSLNLKRINLYERKA